jgi:acid stress-induced BolA-like protein IbaG/YrbA|tara:strand:+ start:256 stop:501 length:246 start_codon:yes stop_codon:yes gene_type:complete
MIEKKIKDILQNKIKDSKVFIQDMNGNQDHFSVMVISSEFENLSIINQHKMIYDALGTMVTNEIHALQIKTFTLEQWKNEN